MTDFKTIPGTHKGAKSAGPVRVPITTLGQRYAAPEGRHSQQTHLRAQVRAEEGGCANEKELHAFDRGVLQSGIDKKALQKKSQQEQNDRTATLKGKPQAEVNSAKPV